MNKRTGKGLLFLLVSNLLIKPLWIFGVDRNVQNWLGTEVYGAYYAVFSFVFLFGIFLDLGINTLITREIAKNEEQISKWYAAFLPIKLLLGLLFFVLIFSIAIFINYNSFQLKILGIIGINMFLISMLLFFRSFFAGLLQFVSDGFLSVADKLVAICLFYGIFWWAADKGVISIEIFIGVQTIGLVVAIILAMILLRNRLNFFRFQVSFTKSAFHLKQSLPFALLVFLMYLYSRIDVVMLERLHPFGAMEAGYYAQTFRLVEASNAFTYLFGLVLLPVFSKHIAKGLSFNSEWLSYEKLFFVPLVLFFSIVPFHAESILNLLYSDVSGQSVAVFYALIFYGFFYAFNYFYGAMLTAGNRLKNLNILSIAGIVINVVINYLLIPKYGAKGAAWASFFTQGFVAVGLLILAYLNFWQGKIDLKYLAKMLIFGFSSCFAAFEIQQFIGHWIYAMLVSILVSILLALVLKLISIKMYLKLLKS